MKTPPLVSQPRVSRWGVIGRGGSAIADQMLSSGSGLLLMVVMAREGQVETFGALSVALISHGFLLGCLRAVVGDVAVIRYRRSPERRAHEERLTLVLGLCSGALAAAVFLVAGSLIGGETGDFLLLFALAAPAVHLQDLRRYLAFAAGRVNDAIVLDGVWLATQAALSGVLLATDTATPGRLVLSWAAGAALSAGVGIVARRWRPSRAGLRAWVAEDGTRAASLLGDFVMSTGMVQAAFLALGAILTLEEFGALRLVFVSLSPLANALAGVRALTLAHYAGLGASPDRAWRAAITTAGAFAGLSAAYSIALVAAPVSWGVAALGEGWREAHAFVAILAIGEALRMCSLPAIDLLKVSAKPSALIQTRTVLTAGGVAGLVAGAVLGGAQAAAISATVAALVAAVVWWRTAATAYRDSANEPQATERSRA